MKLKKKYIHNNKRQIYRLIPTDTNKIIIEERDTERKKVYFNCLQTDSGKKIFKNLQLDEPFWIGIESVYDDIIFFHKFAKPDLPQHLGIIAFDINTGEKIWEDKNRTFLFIKDDKVYSFQQGFENRKYITLNYSTGEVIDELGNDSDSINLLREEVLASEDHSRYHFPVVFEPSVNIDGNALQLLNKLREKELISGKIEFVLMDGFIMFNFHKINSDNSLKNIFKAVNLSSGVIILEKTLNSHTNAFAPDSFFIEDDLLFLLIERTMLGVYRIKN
jgi:hypothetical protein